MDSFFQDEYKEILASAKAWFKATEPAQSQSQQREIINPLQAVANEISESSRNSSHSAQPLEAEAEKRKKLAKLLDDYLDQYKEEFLKTQKVVQQAKEIATAPRDTELLKEIEQSIKFADKILADIDQLSAGRPSPAEK